MRTSLPFFTILLFAPAIHAQWAYDWAMQSSSANVEAANNCAVGADGRVAVVGEFTTDVQLGPFQGDGAPGNGTRGFVACYDADGSFQWAHITSAWHQSGGNCQLWDAAIDGDGNVLVVGQFNDSLMLDGEKVLDAPDDALQGARVFHALKFSAGGDLLWASPVAVEGFTGFAHAIAVNGNGDVYLTGQGGNQFGHLIKLRGSDGAVLYHLVPDGAGAVIGDVAIDGDDNVYITGQAGNAFTMGGLTCPYNNALGGGSTPFFVGKFNGLGEAQWYYVPDQTGSGYFLFPEGNIAVSSDGNCFVETRKRIRINDVTMNDGNGSTHALIALDPEGAVRWARLVNTNAQLAVTDIRCNSEGDALVAGRSYGNSIDLVDTVITSSNTDFNVFLGRYASTTGELTGLLNGPAVTDVMGVGMDANDVPTICGTFSGTVALGSQTLTGSWNMFVTRLGSTAGIAERVDASVLKVAPNPTEGPFTLQLPDASGWDITVMDALGRPLWRARAAGSSMMMDASGWAKGAYHITAVRGAVRSQRTIIVQ